MSATFQPSTVFPVLTSVWFTMAYNPVLPLKIPFKTRGVGFGVALVGAAVDGVGVATDGVSNWKGLLMSLSVIDSVPTFASKIVDSQNEAIPNTPTVKHVIQKLNRERVLMNDIISYHHVRLNFAAG
jgi:hypothetical protein